MKWIKAVIIYLKSFLRDDDVLLEVRKPGKDNDISGYIIWVKEKDTFSQKQLVKLSEALNS